ncbi:hypothetical protein [Nocardioides kribbensis]|uniref:hypothetical protein n=1 Tax=Nocardioides kribbensis TaxID=305517 RepID=UPI001879D57C|nr:hypothetical protein [Nocardioides kribbensis]
MNPFVLGAVVVLGLAVAVLAVVLVVRDVAVRHSDLLFGLIALLELALLVQLVSGSVALAGTERDVEGVTFVAYLVTNLLALPIGAFWALADKTRVGGAVVLVTVLTVLALQLRLVSIWAGA